MQRYENDIEYYNAQLFNPVDAQPVDAFISDIRSQAIIDRPQDWQCSIVRFDVTSSMIPPMLLPMAVAPQQVAGFYPSRLRVGLEHLGVTYSAPVTVYAFGSDLFGAVYGVEELMARFNDALASAYALIPAPTSTQAPLFVFDARTQLVSLYYQATYVLSANPITIWLNSAAYAYVASMPAQIFRGYNNPDGRDFSMFVAAPGAIQLPPSGAGRAGLPVVVQAWAGVVYAIIQQGISVASMNGVRSILITTSMPISSEALPVSGISGQQNSTYSSNSLPILSDFVIGGADPSENPVVDRIQITYLPTAEYRMVQMRGAEPLKRVDLRFFYTLLDGTIKQLVLPPGGHVSAKIVFRRVAR